MKLLSLIASVPKRAGSVLAKNLSRLSYLTGPGGLLRIWRVLSAVQRSLVVLAGFMLFLLVQLGLGYWISEAQWVLMAGVGITLLLVAVLVLWPKVAFYFWLIASPFTYDLFHFEFGHGLPFINVERVILPLLALMLFYKSLAHRAPARRLLAGEWLIVGYCVATAASVFLQSSTIDTAVVTERASFVGLSLLAYYVTNKLVQHERDVSRFLIAIVVTGFLMALTGFYEHFTGHFWQALVGVGRQTLAIRDVGSGRASGPFAEPPAYGLFLAIATFTALHMSAWSRRLWPKFLYYSAAAIMVLGCFWSYTRAAYVGMVVVVISMPLLARGAKRLYLVMLLIAIALLAVAAPKLMQDREFASRMQSTTYLGRLVNSATLISMFKSNPVFGVGAGNSDPMMRKYITNVGTISAAYAHHNPGPNKLTQYLSSSNTHLTILAEQGVVGAALYYGALIFFIFFCLRTARQLSIRGVLGADAAVLIAVWAVAYSIGTMTYDARFHQYPTYVLWATFAVVVRLREISAGRLKSGVTDAHQSALDGSGERA